MFYRTFLSPLGKVVVATDGKNLTGFYFEGQRYFSTIPKDWVKDSKQPPLVEAVRQSKEYFAGNRKKFNLKIAAAGTLFQREVWAALEKIPYGKTVTYADIAKSIGKAKAVRAVGTAIGKNPICIVVPCHRVLATNGSLAGYAGGLKRKADLLKLEGADSVV